MSKFSKIHGRTVEEWVAVIDQNPDLNPHEALKTVPGIGDKRADEILAALVGTAIGVALAQRINRFLGRTTEKAKAVETEAPEAEVEAAKVCAGECGAVLSPEAVEKGWKYCPGCNRQWRKQQGKGKKGGKRPWVSREQVEKAFMQVQGILSGIKGRCSHDPDGRPWGYNYSLADVLFQLAKARYKAGEFGRVELVVSEEEDGTFVARFAEKDEEATAYETLSDFLYQGVLGKANEITAKGDLAFIERLVAEGEIERTDDLQKQVVEVVHLLNEGKNREAAEVASEVKGIAGRMRHEKRETAKAAERADFLERLEEASQPQKQRRGRGKRGGGGRGEPRRPQNEPHQRHGRGMSIGEIVNRQLAEAEEEEAPF